MERLVIFPVKRKIVTSINPSTMPIISRSAAAKDDWRIIPLQLSRSEREERLPS